MDKVQGVVVSSLKLGWVSWSIALFFFFSSCQFSHHIGPISKETVEELFKDQPYKPVEGYLSVLSGTLHYISVGDPAKEHMLLLIHGSPGSWNNYLDYLRDDYLLRHFFIISPDRMGYGGSSGRGVASVAHEACLLGALMARYPQKKVLTVGHSYGGAVAVQLQAHYPDRVAGTLLLAPSLGPDFEYVGFWRYLLKAPILSHLLPRPLAVSNNELIHLQYDLRKLERQYSRITQPVYYIHGTDDWLVSYKNTFYVQEKMAHLPLKTVRLEGANHFIPWTHYAETIKGIRYLCRKLKERDYF